MWHQLQLAYVGIEVPDPASLTPFFGDVVGLVPGEPAALGGSLTWRNDDKAQRVGRAAGTGQRRRVRGLRGSRRIFLRHGDRPAGGCRVRGRRRAARRDRGQRG